MLSWRMLVLFVRVVAVTVALAGSLFAKVCTRTDSR
jgi:hypothetical protein